MNRIRLLDCTLRDGGYVNDWHFGLSTTLCVFERLVRAGIDIIEVGFLDERRPFDKERTIQPDTKCYDEIFAGCDKGKSMVVAMIDYGTCGIEHLSPCSESFIDGIRIIFKKPKMKAAIDFAKQVKALGYEVFLQLVSITSYEDRDILDLCDLINEMKPAAVSMVDTYGLMHKEDMFNYFHLLNHNLNPDITIGYHSHNNFQLGYANELEFLRRSTSRELVVDGTVYGMGKSAGNAPLECLAMNLNENFSANYDLDQILEIIDVNIMRIYREHYWGYSLLFFMAASNNCHPNYITYLLNKHTLSMKAINTIAGSINDENKLDYNESYIEELYDKYQESTVFESDTIEQLRKELDGKNVLLLGPGKSLKTEEAKIRSFIESNNAVVIAVNCLPNEYDADYVFWGNAKRYNMLYHRMRNVEGKCRVIATSNVYSIGRPFDFIFNYEGIRHDDNIIQDNAFVLMLNALNKVGVAEVNLAGFDGFLSQKDDNYYEDYMEFDADYDRLSKVNEAVKTFLSGMKDKIKITFITESLYEG